MGFFDRISSITNKKNGSGSVDGAGAGGNLVPHATKPTSTPPPYPTTDYDDELLRRPPPDHMLQKSKGSLEDRTVSLHCDDPSLISNIGDRQSTGESNSDNDDDDNNSGVNMVTFTPTREHDDADSVEMATDVRRQRTTLVTTTDIIQSNGAIIEKRRHENTTGSTKRNVITTNNDDDNNINEDDAIECNENGVVKSCLPSYRRSGSSRRNNNNRTNGWCVNQDGQREIMAKCSRNGLLIWAILATVLLFINLAVSSGVFKSQNNDTNLSGITSGTSTCTGTGTTVYQAPTTNTGTSGSAPSASPPVPSMDDYVNNRDKNSTGTGSTGTNNNGDGSTLFCGCPSCVAEVWNKPVGHEAYTCGDRIMYLTQAYSKRFPTQLHACRQIAFEYPCDCGSCDPSRCGLYKEEFIVPTGWSPKDDYTAQATPVPVSDLSQYQMYCYPPEGSRKSYSNVWNNGYYIEVKDSSSLGVCGPGDNRFVTDNVIVDPTTNILTLQYKNGAASEVRVLLPNGTPYTYGTYRFDIGSITVTNAAGTVVSNVLPKELILGLFTWDDTENYAIHENYNHEVDIEISRWNCETNSDVQFLVQPPGYPQMHRFFSGATSDDPLALSQENHVYEFTWNPGHIEWYSTAGGGQEFTLKTEEALYMDQPDYVQCMPDYGKQTEVRINLWNNFLTSSTPSFAYDDVVEVVISNFTFTPSSLEFVADGGFCSKHCQCNPTTSSCERGICTNTN